MLIQAPNYTQIPNVIFDYWMEKLTPAEFKVLLFICRKTFGWQKTKDSISRSQIAKMTGLNRDTVRKSITVLEEHNLVIKHQSISEWGDNDPNSYEINIIYTEIPQERGVLNAEGLTDKTPTGGLIKRPTKEISTKEISTKERESPPPISLASPKKEMKKPATTEMVSFGDHVKLKCGEYEKLCEEKGKEIVDYYIKKINNYVDLKKPYKNYRAAIDNWYLTDEKDGKLPSGSKFRISTPSSEKSADRNRKICSLAESKLQNLFNSYVYFQANSSSATLINLNKDIKKEYKYDDYTSEQLKETLLRDLESTFPRAREILLGKKEETSMSNIVNNLKGALCQTK